MTCYPSINASAEINEVKKLPKIDDRGTEYLGCPGHKVGFGRQPSFQVKDKTAVSPIL